MEEATWARVRVALAGLETQRLVVGYSGGADSTCLLHVLCNAGCDVVAAHLHHGQRLEADDEQEACRARAEAWGAVFVTSRADVPALAAERRRGLEEAGREARRAFLTLTMSETQAAAVLLAHTLDDQVETVLYRLSRGTGLRGAGGMRTQAGQFVRPMLHVRRSETRAYCQELGLDCVDDPSNVDLRFVRARLRAQVLPALEAAQPGALEAIARFAAICRADDAVLEELATAAAERAAPKPRPLDFVFDRWVVALRLDALRDEPAAIVSRVVRATANRFGVVPTFDQVHRVTTAALEGRCTSVSLEDSRVRIVVTRDTLNTILTPEQTDFSAPIVITGTTSGPGWVIREGGDGLDSTVLGQEVDMASLAVRPFQPGDRIDCAGPWGSRRVVDVLRESGIDASCRGVLPIVVDRHGIVWIPGIAMSRRALGPEHLPRPTRLTIGPGP